MWDSLSLSLLAHGVTVAGGGADPEKVVDDVLAPNVVDESSVRVNGDGSAMKEDKNASSRGDASHSSSLISSMIRGLGMFIEIPAAWRMP